MCKWQIKVGLHENKPMRLRYVHMRSIQHSMQWAFRSTQEQEIEYNFWIWAVLQRVPLLTNLLCRCVCLINQREGELGDQWRTQGRGPGGPSPLFLDPKNVFVENAPSLSKDLDDRPTPPPPILIYPKIWIRHWRLYHAKLWVTRQKRPRGRLATDWSSKIAGVPKGLYKNWKYYPINW